MLVQKWVCKGEFIQEHIGLVIAFVSRYVSANIIFLY